MSLENPSPKPAELHIAINDQCPAAAVLINGQWCAASGSALTSIDPCSQQTLWQGNGAGEAQIVTAVNAARAAQPRWSLLGLAERCNYLHRFVDQVRQHQSELVAVISRETGKPGWEARCEVQALITQVGAGINAYQQRCQNQAENLSASDGQLQLAHHGHGVIALISPYNFPASVANSHIVPALLAGNTLVFKPSEYTPWSAYWLVKLWQRAGLPDGVLNLLPGADDVAQTLLRQRLDGVIFAGHVDTGLSLHRQFAGRPEVMLSLHMSDCAPLIVEPNRTQLGRAAELIVRSALVSAGQRANCTRRLILLDGMHTSPLLDRVIALCQRLKVATAEQREDAFYGPLISATHQQRILDMQARLASFGGEELLECERVGRTGFALSPGIVDMTNAWLAGINLPDDECFGPLLQVFRVDDFDQALALANDSRFGLAAGLISNDKHQHQQFCQRMRAGVLSINQPTSGVVAQATLAGLGHSGNHHPGGGYAADFCAWPQTRNVVSHSAQITPVALPGLKPEAS